MSLSDKLQKLAADLIQLSVEISEKETKLVNTGPNQVESLFALHKIADGFHDGVSLSAGGQLKKAE